MRHYAHCEVTLRIQQVVLIRCYLTNKSALHSGHSIIFIWYVIYATVAFREIAIALGQLQVYGTANLARGSGVLGLALAKQNAGLWNDACVGLRPWAVDHELCAMSSRFNLILRCAQP